MKRVLFIASLIITALPYTAWSSGVAIRSTSVIYSVARRLEAPLAYAYESLFKTQANWPKVTTIVEFVIIADGTVESVKIVRTEGVDTSLHDPAKLGILNERISEAVYRWRFPPVPYGVVTVEMPFAFRPVEKKLKRTAPSKKPAYSFSGDYGEIVDRDGKKVYVIKELVVECGREQPILSGIPRANPEGDIFARAAKGENEKPVREFLNEAAIYYKNRHKSPTAGLNKKLASRKRERREVEEALSKEVLRAAVADLGVSGEYEWGAGKPNEKRETKLREKRVRLTEEIETLREEINKAEDTWSHSLSGERDRLTTRGEELLDDIRAAGANPWVSLARAELYLEGGENETAARLFEDTLGEGDTPAEAEALYGLAHAHLAAADQEKATQTFLRLTTAYPDSPRRGEAYFWLGDYFTSQREPDKAEKYYLLAAEADVQYRDAALYRAAWGYYECSSPLGGAYYDRAVPAYKRFLDGADEGSEYWDHAIEMTGLCLAEWEPGTAERPAPEEALGRYEEFFGEAEEKRYSADVLRALGEAYQYKMGKLPEGAAAYDRLLAKYPYYDEALDVTDSLVWCHLHQEKYDEAHASRLRLVNGYGPDSRWYHAQAEPKRCEAILAWENALYEVGVYSYVHADRKYKTYPEESKVLYGEAVDHFNQYLATFPTNEKAYHVNFYLAMAHDSLGDYGAAGEEYVKTATHYPDRERYRIDHWAEKGITQENALFNAVVSYSDLFDDEDDASAGFLEPSARQLLATCELFLEHFPESVETPTMLKKMGDTYAQEGDLEKARGFYARIVEEYPDPNDDIFYSKKHHSHFYVGTLLSVAGTYLREAEALAEAGDVAAGDEARAEYQAWYARAQAEAEKRNVDFEEILEDLE